MQTENPTLDVDMVDEVVNGTIVDAGPDHLTVHDTGAGEDLTLRIDDRTTYAWTDARKAGQLTDEAQVRVGFNIAGGVHTAARIIVMDPGAGESIAAETLPSQYQ
ncbi:hypothetical protein ACN469_21760 [Corallococcus terminator]